MSKISKNILILNFIALILILSYSKKSYSLSGLDVLSCETNHLITGNLNSMYGRGLNTCVTSPALTEMYFSILISFTSPFLWGSKIRIKIRDPNLYEGIPPCAYARKPSFPSPILDYYLCRTDNAVGALRHLSSGDKKRAYKAMHLQFTKSPYNKNTSLFRDVCIGNFCLANFEHWVERGNFLNGGSGDQLCFMAQAIVDPFLTSAPKDDNSNICDPQGDQCSAACLSVGSSAGGGVTREDYENLRNKMIKCKESGSGIVENDIMARTAQRTPISYPVSLGCKFLKDPCERSKFESNSQCEITSPIDIMNNNIGNVGISNQCTQGVRSCVATSKKHSNNLVSLTAPIAFCVNKFARENLYSATGCITSSKSIGHSQSKTRLKIFQENMNQIVHIFLIIYALFFGFSMILSPSEKQPKDYINFILKFILVIYFAVGINNSSSNNNNDGMSNLIIPILTSYASEVSSWVLNAGTFTNNLCLFKDSDYSEMSDNEYKSIQKLWDQVDCRLNFYLGINVLLDFANMARFTAGSGQGMHGSSVPPYLMLIIPALLIGNPTFIALVLSYPIILTSFIVFVLGSVLSSIIYLALLCMLAPLFVPMVLFSFTMKYFQSWARMLISCILQPAIALTIMAFLFAIYDYGYFTGCQFRAENVNFKNLKKTGKIYSISNVLSDYNYDRKTMEKCFSSLGYLMNNPDKMLFGGSQTIISDLDTNPERLVEQNTRNAQLENSNTVEVDGLFTKHTFINWEHLANLITNFILAFVVLFVMKNLLEISERFISDLVKGIESSGASYQQSKVAIQGVTHAATGASASYEKGASKLQHKDKKKSFDEFAKEKEKNKEKDKALKDKKNKEASKLSANDETRFETNNDSDKSEASDRSPSQDDDNSTNESHADRDTEDNDKDK